MSKKWLSLAFLSLTGCHVPEVHQKLPPVPKKWLGSSESQSNAANPSQLAQWWKQFNDNDLDWLINQALRNSPDLSQAAARIEEARGLEKTAFANLFPNFQAHADLNRGKQLFIGPITGKSYEAGFDASYEIDLFGKNREAYTAAEAEILATLKDSDWTKLSVIAEIVRTYLSMRAAEKQVVLSEKNLKIQEETLALVTKQHQAGGASEFDVERTALQVNQSKARIADYRRQQEIYMLSLTVLTGLTADAIKAHLSSAKEIPGLNLKAIAEAPALILAHRPDVTAANLRFTQATSLKNSQVANFFPTLSLSSLFGLSRTLLVNTSSVWNLGATAAINLFDFGRIQGQIDAASAREVQAYEAWRKAILQALQDVETALHNINRFYEQKVSLDQAKNNAGRAVKLSQVRYRQGDNSLLDVLDSQHQLIEVDKSLIEAECNYVISIVALYKALGQY
ncbi:efflux transporter outer membrane subunit [Candidatus Odyssella thessalonicensis]|uniref:efflux transporter outer membrane subunit n=1 Tax=Candidatus Odyssella thessalonicensis TaxID=84647 RepID=UPI000225B216|nr:TolC family protein [Candidatus Odyssella thessalonicensis]